MKILVAEDNPVNQKLILSILKKLGYIATLAENGALAYEAATKENFDIIIMDLQMPVMDGLDASRKIKSSDAINPKPIIIALTANAMTGDKERCLEAGMDDYMTKPIQIKVLEENIKKWGNIK
jgi:CheY-like chemotaxis protein